jgi:hypothetical protein
MPNKKLPDDFDWIDARQRCTGKATFNTLRQAVLRDVEKMNEPSKRYDVNDKPDDDYLAVWRLISDAEAYKYFLVTLERTGNHIEISFEHPAMQHPDKPILISVKVSKETGECVFIVNESEVQTWELCQMALEALFFRWPTA